MTIVIYRKDTDCPEDSHVSTHHANRGFEFIKLAGHAPQAPGFFIPSLCCRSGEILNIPPNGTEVE